MDYFQTTSSRIWNRVAEYISYNKHYTMSISIEESEYT